MRNLRPIDARFNGLKARMTAPHWKFAVAVESIRRVAVVVCPIFVPTDFRSNTVADDDATVVVEATEWLHPRRRPIPPQSVASSHR